MEADKTYIRWFDELGAGDVARVGGKNASLGEMVCSLKKEGVHVPGGFATTAEAYQQYVSENRIETAMRNQIEAMKNGKASLHETGEAIRRLFLGWGISCINCGSNPGSVS